MAGDLPIPGDLGLTPLHLFTDAACQRRSTTQVSAWAALLVTGMDSYFQAGLLKLGITDSLEAELLGIAYALQYFITDGRVSPGSRLVVHTDNTTAAHYLNGKAHPKRPEFIATLEHVNHLVAEAGLQLSSSWVRSHQGFDAKCWRGLLNSRVDREARRIAREHGRMLDRAAKEAIPA